MEDNYYIQISNMNNNNNPGGGSPFLLDPANLVSTNQGADRMSRFSPLEAGSRYDRGLNMGAMEGLHYFEQNPRAAQEWYRSVNQGVTGQLFNGFVSRAASIPVKFAEGLASVVGLVGSIFPNKDLEGAFDNSLMHWFASLDEGLREALPVYKSQKYAEGNFLSKAFTTSFWFDDGFDGLAFLGSALMPGAIFSKMGSATSLIGKAGNVGKNIANGLTKAGEALGLSQTTLLTTLYNTAAESGIEAYETNKQILQELAKQRGYDDFSLASAKEQEEMKLVAAERAAQTYWWNMAALIAPNMMQSKLFFGSAADGADEIRRGIRREGKKAADYIAKPKEYLAKFGQNFASEGYWEENIQMSVQQYELRKALGETNQDAISGPLLNLANNAWAFTRSVLSLGMFDTQPHTPEDEAAAAILLGGMIGGNSALLSTYWESKRRSGKASAEVAL